MSGPWEKYREAEQKQLKPWEKYAQEPIQEPKMGAGSAALTGALQGATFGLSDEIIARIGSLSPDLTYEQIKAEADKDLTRAREDQPLATVAGEVGGSLSTGIAGGLTKAGSAVASSLGRGNLPARIAKSIGVGAASGSLYGAGTAEEGKRLEGAKSGAILGGTIGGAIPAIGSAVRAAGGAAVNALGQKMPAISEAGGKVYNIAKRFNVPMAMDDLTDDIAYKTMISEGRTLPGSAKFADFGVKQHKRWVNEVAKTFGEDTPIITPEIVDKAFTRLGGEFDNFFKGKVINLGEEFGLGLRQKDFIEEVGDLYSTPGKDTITKFITQINSAIRPDGTIDGTILGNIRSRASRVARSGNPEIAGAARDVEQFIIDSVADVSEEGAKQAFKKTKYQYKNLIAVEPLAQKAQVSGLISPAQLLGRVRQVYGRSFSRGNAGDIGDLANLGQYIKETIPNSGTSQRSSIRKMLTGEAISSIPLSVGAGLISGNPLASVGVTAAAMGAKGVGAAINRSVQNKNVSAAAIEKMIANGGKLTVEMLNSLPKEEKNKLLRKVMNMSPAQSGLFASDRSRL